MKTKHARLEALLPAGMHSLIQTGWATLPVELLVNIGEFALAANPDYVITMGRVCSTWRRVAFGSPILWSRLDLTVDHPVAKMKKWLEFSKQSILELRVPSFEYYRPVLWTEAKQAEWEATCEAITTDLLPVLENVHSVYINKLPGLWRGMFGQLQHFEQPGGTGEPLIIAWITGGIDESHPTLRSIVADIDLSSSKDLPQGSARLGALETFQGVVWSVCEFLRECSKVKVLKIVDWNEKGNEVGSIHLPNLQVLGFEYDAKLMDYIDSPNPASLQWHDMHCSVDTDGPFTRMAARQGLSNLVSLSMCGAPLNAALVIKHLPDLDNLQHLHIGGWLTYLVADLTIDPATLLLPNLRALSIQGIDIASDRLLSIVESRTTRRPHGVAQLLWLAFNPGSHALPFQTCHQETDYQLKTLLQYYGWDKDNLRDPLAVLNENNTTLPASEQVSSLVELQDAAKHDTEKPERNEREEWLVAMISKHDLDVDASGRRVLPDGSGRLVVAAGKLHRLYDLSEQWCHERFNKSMGEELSLWESD